MRAEAAAALCCLLGWLPALCSCAGGQGRGVAAPAVPQVAAEAPLAPFILAAVRSMPVGGGYAADRAAELRLAEQGITWHEGQLRLSPTGASPTFCSAACYLVLLRALKSWEQQAGGRALPARVWHSLRVEPLHPDGYLSWGRVNANGPGFAKWVHDLGAGVSFCSVAAARPGDFLKFFHTPAIGARERGHMVIYLGLVERDGQPCIRYWSSNKPGGYGERITPLAGLHHPVFTRITHPELLARAPELPGVDPWLASLLTRESSVAELRARCPLHGQ